MSPNVSPIDHLDPTRAYPCTIRDRPSGRVTDRATLGWPKISVRRGRSPSTILLRKL